MLERAAGCGWSWLVARSGVALVLEVTSNVGSSEDWQKVVDMSGLLITGQRTYSIGSVSNLPQNYYLRRV